MGVPKREEKGSEKNSYIAGLEVRRHDDYIRKVSGLPEGADDRIMVAIRTHMNIFRKSKRKSGLAVAVLDSHFSFGYQGPAAEVLFGTFQGQFILLDIRVGGFSEEELTEYDKLLRP